MYKIKKISSRSTLLRWIKTYKKNGKKWETSVPNYKCSTIEEYSTGLTKEEIAQFKKFLFHSNKFNI